MLKKSKQTAAGILRERESDREREDSQSGEKDGKQEWCMKGGKRRGLNLVDTEYALTLRG